LILEKARREDEPLRLSPQLKESMIASSQRNIKDLEEAKSKIADAISAAIKEVEDEIKAQKKLNAKAKKEGKEEDIIEQVRVLDQFIDFDESKKEIKEKAEDYVVNNLPRNARGRILLDMRVQKKRKPKK
jgi:pantothenate synthetase